MKANLKLLRDTYTNKTTIGKLYLNDVFTWKIVSDIWIWLDNYNQDLYVDTFMAWVNNVGNRKLEPSFDITYLLEKLIPIKCSTQS